MKVKDELLDARRFGSKLRSESTWRGGEFRLLKNQVLWQCPPYEYQDPSNLPSTGLIDEVCARRVSLMQLQQTTKANQKDSTAE